MADAPAPVTLRFFAGTLEVHGADADASPLAPGLRWDRRTACWRAPAVAYRDVVRNLVRAEAPFVDEARAYGELSFSARARRTPRDYQAEALAAWERAGGRGLVVLPTGAGKTLVGMLAIEAKARDTLVVAPTLDLVWQWHDVLTTTFGPPIGVVGGGEHDVQALTITTYDSAHLHMDHLGNRFGLVIFDEVHHLGGATFRESATMALAPFRLGLSATPERDDDGDAFVAEHVGPVVLRREVTELEGAFLSRYDTRTLSVSLSDEERLEYEEARATYLDFIRSQGIRVAQRGGWAQFVMRAATSDEGMAALRAHRRSKELAEAAPAKLDVLGALLHQHRHDQVLVFTQDNATAYKIARRFLVPAITHQTKVSERTAILEAFRAGTFSAVVTSKVLNEGVDVPAANVAVVVSGSGSVREHVQRLGRILRPDPEAGPAARAVLYELLSADTSETGTSQRRRDHVAYRSDA